MNIEGTALFKLWGWLGTLIGALVVIAVAAILVHVVVVGITKMIDKASDGRIKGSIFVNISRVVIWFASIALIMNICLGIDPAPIWGALGIGGIALSLGAQSTISNLLGGLQVTLSRDTSIGDWIIVGSIEGEVKDITWRKMLIEDEFGNLHNIPNSVILSSPVSVLTKYFTTKIPLALNLNADVDAIEQELPLVVSKALVGEGMQYEDKLPKVVVTGTTVSGINAILYLYANRAFSTAQVTKTGTDAAVAYLVERDALAAYEG